MAAIMQRYRRRETSVEEALVKMYLAGVSVPSGSLVRQSVAPGVNQLI
jgi:transposase-like protein